MDSLAYQQNWREPTRTWQAHIPLESRCVQRNALIVNSQISGFRFNLVILLGVLILWISRETQNLFLGLDFPEEILICPSEALQQRHYSVNYSQAMQYTTCNLLQFQVRAFPSFRLQ